MAEQLEDFTKPLGLSGMPSGHFIQALAEDLPLAAGIVAPPASDTNHQFHRPSLHGKIPQTPQIAAVARLRRLSTVWAAGRRRARRRSNRPTVIVLIDAVRLQRASIGQKLFATQYVLHNSRLVTLSSRPDFTCTKIETEPLICHLTHGLAGSLRERLALLERKRAQFVLAAPLSGTVFGEDLPRLSGEYFSKGAEICRIADVHELLARVQVPEREIGDISIGKLVRLKARAFPNRIFHGRVSRIGSESDLDLNRQPTYRVELTIQNHQGLLRPGMTIFARIDIQRHMVGWILAHKFKQMLRPELWML
jgi:multidrug efflux pump subunit AcrA (membrane-fusion protein)